MLINQRRVDCNPVALPGLLQKRPGRLRPDDHKRAAYHLAGMRASIGLMRVTASGRRADSRATPAR